MRITTQLLIRMYAIVHYFTCSYGAPFVPKRRGKNCTLNYQLFTKWYDDILNGTDDLLNRINDLLNCTNDLLNQLDLLKRTNDLLN